MDKEDVAHIYNGILLSHKKETNWVICSEVDGPRGYYSKWNKSDSKKQIPYVFTYMWNLKSKKQMNQHNKHSHRYREQTGSCHRRGSWMKEKGEVD